MLLNYRFIKEEIGRTEMTDTIKSLCPPEDWIKVKDDVLQVQDYWLSVAKVLILCGWDIRKSIEVIPDVYSFSIKYGMIDSTKAAEAISEAIRSIQPKLTI